MQNLQIPFVCSECKRSFMLDSEVIKKLALFIDEDFVTITFFDCECGKRYFVQVDNEKTKGMLKEIMTLMAKASDSKSKGKGIKKKYSARYKVLSNKLKEMRLELMRKYEGRKYFDSEMKKLVEIHFSC